MRALRVVGLDESGENVVLEDAERGERFTLTCDDRLRAAARGDVTRLGQAQIELESHMRPREIQARIRAGESVDQLASAAGVPAQKIEKYAYPVLLERSRTAEMAQQAHPFREDGPDVQTLGEVVAHAFTLRGQDFTETAWDSWRGEDNKWIVQLTWSAGRSQNRAHWVFHPGAHGGTVSAIDEHAADLLDPNPARGLRTVRPVTKLARQALLADGEPAAQAPIVTPREPAEEAPSRVEEPVAETPAARTPAPRAPATRAATNGTPAIPPIPPLPARKPAAEQPTPEPAEEVEPAEDEATESAGADPATGKRDATQRRGKKSHPIVPSWEDVLLGVRSQRG